MRVAPVFLYDVSFWIAVYGAVVATGVAVLQLLAHRRDRGALKIVGTVEPHVSGKPELRPDVVVTITNTGRRVVRPVELGVIRKGGNRALVPLDIMLLEGMEEGEPRAVTIDPPFDEIPDAVTLYVKDSRGRERTMSRRAFRALRDSFALALTACEEARRRQALENAREWAREILRDPDRDE